MSTQPFIIERTYHAPIEKVWKAITNKDDMKEWYFDLAEFKPVVGFAFEFYGKSSAGQTMKHLCQITEVQPPRKLVYSWKYEGYPGLSYVAFELFPDGNNTRLRLTHSGLETFPPLSDFAKENFAEGWTLLIGSLLKNFLEQ